MGVLSVLGRVVSWWWGSAFVPGAVPLCRLCPQGSPDRVQVDEDCRPGCLEGGLAPAAVAALAGAVAVHEQGEQPLDQRAAAAQVLARRGIFERLAAGLEEVLPPSEADRPEAVRGAAVLERAGAAERGAEADDSLPRGLARAP